MLTSSWEKRLSELNFTTHDAVVYEALIRQAPCLAGALIAVTGLHRNVVYTSLEHLVARKLVAKQETRSGARFSLADPSCLREEFLEKAEIASQVVEEIRARLQNPVPTITVHTGNDEYLSLLTSLLKRLPVGATKYVLGTGGAAFMDTTMQPIWKPYHDVVRARDIRIRMIAYEHQRSAIEPRTKPLSCYDVRYLSSALENPSGLHIYPEAGTVLTILYSNEHQPVTAINMQNPALVQGHLNVFEQLWKTAK